MHGPTYRLVPPHGATTEGAAAACAATILTHVGLPSWVVLAQDYNQRGEPALCGLEVPENVRELLDTQAWLVNRISLQPLVTVVQCDRCGRVQFSSTGKDAPCGLTMGCVGKLTRPPAATLVPVDNQDTLLTEPD